LPSKKYSKPAGKDSGKEEVIFCVSGQLYRWSSCIKIFTIEGQEPKNPIPYRDMFLNLNIIQCLGSFSYD